jgi:hypothetical protein
MYYLNTIYRGDDGTLNYRVNIVEEDQKCFYKTTNVIYQSYLENDDLGSFLSKLINEGICID